MAEQGGAMVHALVYTDPACPYSWAAEPALRGLEARLGETLAVDYVLAGAPTERRLAEWLDATAASGMPADPRLWLDAPPRSSQPACLAVKAAEEQGLGGAYLRRAREGFAYERRALDTPDALTDLARTVGGLDAARFRRSLESSATLEALGADLERARDVPLPSVRFAGPGGEHWARGTWDVDAWEQAARAAGAGPFAEPPTIPAALRAFGPMGTPEVAAVCGLAGPRAPAELWRAAAEWQALVERLPCGEVWRLSP